jgi:zinc-binding alcohol dehydrogenase family protein
VQAVSVNPVDVKVRAPKAQVETTPRILGWDVAGVVEATGPDCQLFAPGDAVFYAGAYLRPGANSTFHVVDERLVGARPRGLDAAQAAALPLTGLTAWEALFERIGLRPEPQANRGTTLLIVNAAGGVGSIATQLARWAGLRVIGTASRPESQHWVQQQGAELVVNHRASLAAQLAAHGYAAVDAILCLKQTRQHWQAMVDLIAPLGTICLVDDIDAPLELGALHAKSATVVCENVFTRPNFQSADLIAQHQILNRIAALVDEGVIQTTLTQRLAPFNAATLRQAHALVEQGDMIGKIAVEGFEEGGSDDNQ